MSDHEQSRRKVCVICSRKATVKLPLSEKDVTLIKELVDNEFTCDDPDYLCGLCNGCYLVLNKKRSRHDVELSIIQVYKSVSRSRFLRSVDPCYNCSICEIAHSNVNQIVSPKKKQGRTKTENLTNPFAILRPRM